MSSSPFVEFPGALLSDRGTSLLSHVTLDVCKLLGINKLNTTAYHPKYDRLAERYNHTLKTALRKHAAQLGTQWDKYTMVYCGPTITPHMRPLMKSHHICCLGWTFGLQRMLPYCTLQKLSPETCAHTEKSSLSACPTQESLQHTVSDKPNRSTKHPTIKERPQLSTMLVTGS